MGQYQNFHFDAISNKYRDINDILQLQASMLVKLMWCNNSLCLVAWFYYIISCLKFKCTKKKS